MAFKTMEIDTLYEIYRRWQSGQSKSRIERATGVDRKTVSVNTDIIFPVLAACQLYCVDFQLVFHAVRA